VRERDERETLSGASGLLATAHQAERGETSAEYSDRGGLCHRVGIRETCTIECHVRQFGTIIQGHEKVAQRVIVCSRRNARRRVHAPLCLMMTPTFMGMVILITSGMALVGILIVSFMGPVGIIIVSVIALTSSWTKQRRRARLGPSNS
jgi:hypothetical protein